MDAFVELLKILLPAAIVLYGMYLTMRSILVKDLEKKMIDYKIENSKSVLSNRLQAYERMCLFLERIAPNNLLLRLSNASLSALEYQHLLTHEIREEFNHNLSQQVYMSDEVWNMIRDTLEDIIATINACAREMKEDAKAVDLAKKVIEESEKREKDPVRTTLSAVKAEIREIF
jgi:hypothetical protein